MEYDGVITKPSLDELYHHGVQGMKWGVRNGPPYPLDSSISTGKRLKNTGSKSKKKTSSAQKSKVGMDPFAAAMLIRLGAYGVFALLGLAAATADSLSLSPQQKTEYIKNKNRYKKVKDLKKGTEKDKETGFKLKKDQNATMEEDMEAVNYLRGKRLSTKSTYVNCAYCTTAYDLRRRGFEVSAPTTSAGVSTRDIESWYKNGKATTFKAPKDVKDNTKTAGTIKRELMKQPSGARGNLTIFWKSGGGHSVAYEIVNKKLVILDTQQNRKYEGTELDNYLARAVIQNGAGQTSMYIRTDTLEPEYEILKKRGIVK